MTKVRQIIDKGKTATQAEIIMQLNPVLRGWARYHRHVVSYDTFTRIDTLVWDKLWRWSKRRHPKKNQQWIKVRYFERHGTRDWIFACAKTPENLSYRPILFRLSSIGIIRHVKIRAEANPFHPDWADYFDQRQKAA